MIHRDAIRMVEQYGGRATYSVSGSTTMLVIGEEGWPLEEDGGASQKLQQVMQLIADGSDVRVVGRIRLAAIAGPRRSSRRDSPRTHASDAQSITRYTRSYHSSLGQTWADQASSSCLSTTLF